MAKPEEFERKPLIAESSRHEVYLKIPLDAPNWRIDYNSEGGYWVFYALSSVSVEDAKGKLIRLASTIMQELSK